MTGSVPIIGLIDVVLLTFLVILAVAMIRLRDLFAVAMLFSAYSLMTAGLFVDLDAADVAFTEAAVGAGISTVLLVSALRLVPRREKPRPKRRLILPLVVVAITGAALVYGTLDAPILGDPQAPAQQHIAPYYIATTESEIGIPNLVTAVLASFRGYDTLGETVVVFVAGISVLLLLGVGRDRVGEPRVRLPPGPPSDALAGGLPAPKDLVLRSMTRLLVPVIVLFALYVQFHGDYGPGGGFQAGVILASALILNAMVAGVERTMTAVPIEALRLAGLIGVMVFIGVGLVAMALGGHFLDYGPLAHDPKHGQHIGIILVELGVGITVFSVITAIFFAFASRPRSRIS